ncbi:MAG: hypothetical protein IJ598_02235 [Ruminococcus sp.]|nr:hypothetical protein [Ruminococcus sp.]
MTKKAAAICVLIGIIAGLLGACSIWRSNQAEDTHTGVLSNVSNALDKSYNFDNYFIDLGSSYPYHFMYDRFTNVMYVEEMNRSYNLVALIKADGTPLTYDEWNQSVIKETR